MSEVMSPFAPRPEVLAEIRKHPRFRELALRACIELDLTDSATPHPALADRVDDLLVNRSPLTGIDNNRLLAIFAIARSETGLEHTVADALLDLVPHAKLREAKLIEVRLSEEILDLVMQLDVPPTLIPIDSAND